MADKNNIDKVDCPRCKGAGYVKRRKKISLSQRKYYFGVIVNILSVEWGEDADTTHELLKAKFNYLYE